MEKRNDVVRMILWDYDAAPDGVGTYVKLDAKFSSVSEALSYRDVYLHGMYWGHIEEADGTIIQSLDEMSDEDEGYNPYEDIDEY